MPVGVIARSAGGNRVSDIRRSDEATHPLPVVAEMDCFAQAKSPKAISAGLAMTDAKERQ